MRNWELHLHQPTAAELECIKLHGCSYAISWRCRDGSYHRVSACPTLEDAEVKARAWDWPGHPGTRWRYFLDDLRAFRSRITRLWREKK